jgi:hypothetical protein
MRLNLLLFMVLFPLLLATHPTTVQAGSEGYTYYGFIPSAIPNYGTLFLVGNHDETRCRVYILPEGKLVEDFTLNMYETWAINLPNGTLFKIQSDKHVTVIIKGRAQLGNYKSDVTTAFPSVEGTYIGKEFIFPTITGAIEFAPFRIFSLEPASVKIYEADGSLFKKIDLPANGFFGFPAKNGTVYHVQSTGYIEVATFTFAESYFVPAATGGFVGKTFYGSADRTQGGRGEGHFRRYTHISSVEGATVKIFDLKVQKWVKEIKVPPRSVVSIDTKKLLTHATWETGAYVLTADRPVSVLYLSNYTGFLNAEGNLVWLEGGVSVVGVRPGERALIIVTGNEAYVFAREDCVVTLNDLEFRLAADDYLRLEPGTYEVATTRPIIIQTVNFAPLKDGRYLIGFAEALPAVETFGLAPTDLKLTPPREESMMGYYVAAGGAAAAIIAVIFFMRRRKERQSRP